MAINTRGFQVSVMPQFTPVDPSLVAYNPQETTQGLLQALNAVETDRQMRAQRAARAERDLLAGKRIAATEAEYDSVISRLPAQTQDILAQIAANAQTRPSATEASINQNEASILRSMPEARAAADQAVATSRMIPARIDTESAELRVRRGEAETAAATAAARRQSAVNAANQQRALTDAANATIQQQIAAQNAAAELASRQGAAALASFDQDEKNRQRSAELDMAVKEAQAANLNAEAIARLSAPSKTQEDAIKKAQAASTLAKSLREATARGERSTVGEYLVRTRDAQGNINVDSSEINKAAELQVNAILYLENLATNAIIGNDTAPAQTQDVPVIQNVVTWNDGKWVPVKQ